MYRLKPGIKGDPKRRWALSDAIFFGHGACHILAGTYLTEPPLPGFKPEGIVPEGDVPGHHVYVTDGLIAFDFYGYSLRESLLDHHRKGWSRLHAGWDGRIEPVDFDLLDTTELNRRKMLGREQYWQDPVSRALRFIRLMDHSAAAAKALRTRG